MSYQTLKEQIEEMLKVDQDLRFKAGREPGLINYLVYCIDEIHNARIKRIIKKYGWPTSELIGADGMKSFWLLIQHQDYDLDLQEEALRDSDFAPKEKAYLTDRILINQGKLQLYGTQFKRDDALSQLVPLPIENPETVNERRKEAGLESLEAYLEEANKVSKP